MKFLDFSDARYIDDLLINTVVDDAVVNKADLTDESLAAYAWDGLVVVSRTLLPFTWVIAAGRYGLVLCRLTHC